MIIVFMQYYFDDSKKFVSDIQKLFIHIKKMVIFLKVFSFITDNQQQNKNSDDSTEHNFKLNFIYLLIRTFDCK